MSRAGKVHSPSWLPTFPGAADSPAVTERPEPLKDTALEVWFAGVHSDVGGTFEHAGGGKPPLLSAITLK